MTGYSPACPAGTGIGHYDGGSTALHVDDIYEVA